MLAVGNLLELLQWVFYSFSGYVVVGNVSTVDYILYWSVLPPEPDDALPPKPTHF